MNEHRTWIENYSERRGNDGPKVADAVLDYMANNEFPPGRSALSWMQELCVTLGYQFNLEFPNCAESVSGATIDIDTIIYSATIPAEERQRAILAIYRECRQWLAFADLDATDRFINRLIDEQEFQWPKETTLDELRAYYGPTAFVFAEDDWTEEFDLESIDWNRVAKCAHDFAQSGVKWAELVA